jgi:condensin-2 complex subunit G2
VGTLGLDSACANIRRAVFAGLAELLAQPLAGPVLQGLLPILKNSIHDKSERVRIAFLKLLCQLKDVGSSGNGNGAGVCVKYYEVVPIPHLLER